MFTCSLLLLSVNKLYFLLRYKPESYEFDYRCCHCNLSFTESFRPYCGIEFDLASNRNSTRNIPWVSKGGRCVRLTTLPYSCAIAWNSGNFELLEPSWSVPTCTGFALHIPTLDTQCINQQQCCNCADCDAAHEAIPCDRTLLEILTVAEFFKEFSSLFIIWNSSPFQHTRVLPMALILSSMNPVNNVILFKVIF